MRTKLCGAALAVLVALLIGEIVVRIVYPTIHMRGDMVPGIYVADEELGAALKPDYDGVFLESFREFSVRTDRHGMRGPNRDPVPVPGEIRVLNLGDSSTFGMGVADDETFSVRLEHHLDGMTGNRARTWNAGVAGYATREELAMLRRLAPVIRPHVVTIGWLHNDLPRAVTPFPRRLVVIDGYMTRTHEAYLRFRAARDRRPFWEHSQLAKLAVLNLRILKHDRNTVAREEEQRAKEVDAAAVEANADQLAEVVRTAEAAGARCIVMIYGTRQEVVTGEPRPGVRAVMDALSRRGIPYVDLVQVFRREMEARDTRLYCLRDSIHPNAAGHDLTAREIAHRIAGTHARGGGQDG
ncbi:MAG: SGNH/GDSL hydrolase family protein [Planctomycetota bacterium]